MKTQATSVSARRELPPLPAEFRTQLSQPLNARRQPQMSTGFLLALFCRLKRLEMLVWEGGEGSWSTLQSKKRIHGEIKGTANCGFKDKHRITAHLKTQVYRWADCISKTQGAASQGQLTAHAATRQLRFLGIP